MASKKFFKRSLEESDEHKKEVERLNKIFASRKEEITAALGKAKELEKKKLPSIEDIKKHVSELKKDEGILKKLMKPQWFLEKQKKFGGNVRVNHSGSKTNKKIEKIKSKVVKKKTKVSKNSLNNKLKKNSSLKKSKKS